MTATLLIDQGNTRAKFALYDHQTHVITSVQETDLKQIAYQFILLAAVGTPEETLKILNPRIPIRTLSTPREAFDMKVAYSEPSKLGVDRWLAILGAYAYSGKACVVIDLGTATTIDVVTDKGVHLGGYILPGIATSQQALFTQTNKIMAYQSVSANASLGNTTERCITNGVALSQFLLIEKTIKEHKIAYPECECFVTGGAKTELLPFFIEHEVPVQSNLDLVFLGMSQYIEQ